jgi:hypothetical protein
VGEVGVHLDTGVEPVVEAPPEPGPVGAPEARLAVPTEQLDSSDLLPQRFGDLGGAVGATVVDDQHGGLGERVTNAPQYTVDVL